MAENDSVESLDQTVRSQSQTAMRADISLLDDMLLHLNHGMSPLTGKIQDRSLNFLVSLLLVRTFNSLWRAREDALTGYPVQSMTLCRSALEDWVTACHVEKHPDRSDRWLAGILPESAQAKAPIDFKTMFAEVEGEIGAKAREMYDVLNKFAHPNGGGMQWLMHWDPESTYLHFGGHFDRRALRFSLYFLLTQAQMAMERVAQLQYRVMGEVDADWLSRGDDLTNQGIAFIERVHDEVVRASSSSGFE